MAELLVEGISKRFGAFSAVKDVSFTIRDGEFFSLLGPSGCGKSTTLSIIAGLVRPDQGKIRLGETTLADCEAGIVLPTEKRDLGMVFQSYALWPHLTVAENLAVPLKLRKVDSTERRERIDAALVQIGLEGLNKRYPHE